MAQRRLAGKVAFITGAARGQGRAEAVRLAAEGADIVAVDSCANPATTAYGGATRDDLAETERLVEATGQRAAAHVADVRDFEALEATWQAGIEGFGPISVVVANAGVCSANRLWETSAEQWEEMLGVNLTGVFNTFKVAARSLVEQGQGGSLIATGSTAGLKGLPFLGAYSATKHGVVGLVRTLANELGAHAIRVNAVHPTGVSTGMDLTDLAAMVQAAPAELRSIFLNAMPHPGLVEPEDVAAVVAWLASDEARYVTGAQIPVDLGMSAR
ncbi:MAG: mycofactocin-coupled SDR family oxidoreductase [Acidimicrobiales bacterium]